MFFCVAIRLSDALVTPVGTAKAANLSFLLVLRQALYDRSDRHGRIVPVK